MRTPEDLGRLIRDARRRAGLRQADLAARAGVGRPWLSELENGKPRAELELVLRVVAALGLELDLVDPAEKASAASTLTPVELVDLDAWLATFQQSRG